MVLKGLPTGQLGSKVTYRLLFFDFFFFSLSVLKRSLYCKEDEGSVGFFPVSPSGIQSKELGTSVGMKRHGLKLT